MLHTSLPRLDRLPGSLSASPPAGHIESLQQSPAILVAGTPYFVMSVQPQTGQPGHSLFVLYPRTSLLQARREAVMPSPALGTASLGLMMLVTSRIANQISGRLGRVQRQVARIADGDFRDLDPGGQGDEVADLTLSINRMCAQLKQMQQAIHQSERARLLAEPRAGLAHQLRNSLPATERPAPRQAAPEFCRRPDAHRGARQLALTEEHVRGLLSIGRVEPQPAEVCELRQVLEDVAFLVGPACQHARLFTQPVDQGTGSFEVLADRSGLLRGDSQPRSQCHRGGRSGGFGLVAVEIHRHENEVSVEVVDSGPGPPLSWRRRSAMHSSRANRRACTGLRSARQVAVDHGGRLSWSRSGRETRFRLALPRHREPAKGVEWAHLDRG